MSSQTNTVALHRVVITGMGAVSPAGLGVETLWSKVTSGECCLSLFPEERREQLGVNVGGIIPGYDPLEVGFTKRNLADLHLSFSMLFWLPMRQWLRQASTWKRKMLIVLPAFLVQVLVA